MARRPDRPAGRLSGAHLRQATKRPAKGIDVPAFPDNFLSYNLIIYL